MVALMCDFCGGKLIMKNESLVQCEYCGMEFSKERIQQKIQEIKGSVKVEGAVETVKGSAEKERLLQNAETFLRIKDYVKSEEIYSEVTNQYPDDYRGWFGLLTLYCNYYNYLVASKISDRRYFENLYPNICNYANNVAALTNDPNAFTAVVNQLKAFFAKKEEADPRYLFDSITQLYESLQVFKPYFADLKAEADYGETIKAKFNALDNSVKMKIVAKYWPKDYTHQPRTDFSYYCTFVFKNRVGFGFSMPYWDINPEAKFTLTESIDTVINTEIMNYTIKKRKSEEVCIHCGGAFKGFFKRVCSKCGKPKDY